MLGDTVDGWTETDKCITELLKLRKCINIIGNHDLWFLNWALRGHAPIEWTTQGGDNTMACYGNEYINVPQAHKEFFMNANSWIEIEDDDIKRLFIHAGFDPNKDMSKQTIDLVTWDRDLLSWARKKHNSRPDYKYGGFDEVFIGHTTTNSFDKDGYKSEPKHYCNIWALDTGGGWEGKLTIMNIKTKEFFQSDHVYTLYPDEKGRG